MVGTYKPFEYATSDKPIKLVIRVDDRGKPDLAALHAHPVSEYFSKDYATFMMRFDVEGNGIPTFRPVVISELANKGDLHSYALSLSGKPINEITASAQSLFSQIADFCLKLKDTGHYHSDIKLSNFLTDGEHLIISDRKTFIRLKITIPYFRQVNS